MNFSLNIDAARPGQRRKVNSMLLVAAGLLLALAASSCSAAEPQEAAAPEVLLTPRQTAEEVIRTKISAQAGLGGLLATCQDVAVVELGTKFNCQGTTKNGAVISMLATVKDDGLLDIVSTNLITAQAVPSFEIAAVDALNQDKSALIPYENIECGDQPKILTPQSTMACTIIDPPSSLTYSITFQVRDVEARRFCLAVGKEPISADATPVPQAMAEQDCPI